MSVRLFVGNLPYDATEDEIRTHFSAAGNVLNVFLPVDRETGRKRGFAFVEFNDNAQAQEAIRLYNSQPFKGRALAVNEARAREARPPGAGGAPYRPPFRPGGPPPTGSRPSGPMGRPPGSFGGPPGRDSRPDASTLEPGRGDKPNRKQFGPDAKPFRNRNQKVFKPEGAKKTFKEKAGGQLYSMDDDAEQLADVEIDDFATAVENEGKEEEENP